MSRRNSVLLVLVLCCECGAGQPPVDRKDPVPLEARGSIVPARRASVTSTTAGRIAEVLVEEGQAVKKAQVLLRLERAGAEAGLRRAEAGLELALANLKRAEARDGEELTGRAAVARAEAKLQAAELTLTRLNKLRDSQVISMEAVQNAEQAQRVARADLDRAKASFEALRKDVAGHRLAARAEVEVARAKAEQARRAVEATEVRAPIDGILIGLN